jgi:hypothetical protein
MDQWLTKLRPTSLKTTKLQERVPETYVGAACGGRQDLATTYATAVV